MPQKLPAHRCLKPSLNYQVSCMHFVMFVWTKPANVPVAIGVVHFPTIYVMLYKQMRLAAYVTWKLPGTAGLPESFFGTPYCHT